MIYSYCGCKANPDGAAREAERRRTIRHGQFLCAAFLLAASQMAYGQGILGSNLIVNGNAEMGPAGTATTTVTSIPGWTVTGEANVLPYGLTGYVLLTDPTPAPPPFGPGPGFQYFGCRSGACTLIQNIDVSSGASIISGGNVKFTAFAYLGTRIGGGSTNAPHMTVAFENASGQEFAAPPWAPEGPQGWACLFSSRLGSCPLGRRGSR